MSSLARSESTRMRLQQVSLVAGVGSHYLLQDVSCEVFRGDRIAIIGPSGAGKTSLLKLLNRLSEITQGQIYFGDREIRQIPVLQLRQRVTLVLQESKLLGMTVREALLYPLRLRGIERSLVQQRLEEWTERLHIPLEWLDRTELQLSVGQRQLVAIARALIVQPEVLLLDEPTSALDAGRAAHVVSVLANWAESSQASILMVNHQLELAEQFCNRVLYLHKGKLTKDLSVAKVNWDHLKQTLIKAEAEIAQEWE
ncbi:MAG: ATP-binding cassette domain-containing protein [Leptolyngbyaceae cyanobacterium SL_5_9]|nr:ATP-binding cassette domain-containing protein [Leptolyngbyaceae cyanobacterium SL_5_9]NJO72301.1 ATP-binding cassette domain-containing protein [Leptolyngbyaceae cyanobacterium RM1_406_9]